MDKQEDVWAHVCIDGVVAVVYGLKLAKRAVAELVSSFAAHQDCTEFSPTNTSTSAQAHACRRTL